MLAKFEYYDMTVTDAVALLTVLGAKGYDCFVDGDRHAINYRRDGGF